MTIRYGLIGSGMMGQEHIRNLNLLEGAQVTAIADPDVGMRDLSAQMTDGPASTFADHKEMLSADLCDAYVIVSPNDTHHNILLDLVDVNKPILCEKPLCTTSADCRDVLAKFALKSAPVWVAMEYRYMPPVQRLINETMQGTVGQAKMIAIREHRFPFLDKVGDWNRFNERTGGTLVEKCCHFWDLMRLVMQSDPVRVFASAAADVNHQDETYDGRTPDIIDNAFVVIDFENGTRGMLDLCMFAEGSKWQEVVSVTGPKARIDACVPGPARFSKDGKEQTSQLVFSDRVAKQERIEPVEVDHAILQAGDHHGSSFFQHQRFLQLVRGEISAPEVSLEDGLWSVLIGEAAEKSAVTGQAVALK
ncbi:MAG: Gfo/Idh/MocA family oxidoreductase [Hyphomicrobiales bacterium]|nr:Gfo/Idh/MocA family oxidoreductase [Hyphomicrobiales bacterium]